MRNTILIVKNIFKRIYKKPTSYLLHFVLPVAASIALFLIYSSFSSSTLHLGIVDNDRSDLSRVFIESIDNTDGLTVSVIENGDIDSSIIDRYVSYGIVIEKGFEENILDETNPQVEIISLDGSDGIQWLSELSVNHVGNMLNLSSISEDKNALITKLTEIDNKYYSFQTIQLEDQSIEKNATVSVFGIYMIFILISTFLTSFHILKEKELGTFARIGIAPVHPKNYILSNIIANFIIMSIQVGLVMTMLTVVFKVNFYTNPLFIYLVVELFALCAISVGVLLVTITKDVQTAGAALGLIVSPSCMIAGCMWPLDSMPNFMQKIAYITPQRWTLDAIEMLQQSRSLQAILPNILVVAGFTVLFFLISVNIIKNDERIFN